MGATLSRSPRRAGPAGLAALAGLLPTAAGAHFQLLYTPEAALNESAALELALVFSHPFDNGYTMDMGQPEAFYVVSQRGEADLRSDIDLMVIRESDFREGESRRRELGRLYEAVTRTCDAPKDIVLFTKRELDEWRHTTNHLISEALRDGRLLYGEL